MKLSYKSIILYLLIISVSLLLLSTTVHAEELPETESITDSEQNERLNALEIRLEELGYQINEITGTLEEVQTSELTEQEERLIISEKIDILIVGINDLIKYQIELLNKYDISETVDSERQLQTEEYRLSVLDALALLNNTSIQHFDSTVSGNYLISQLDQNLLQMDENMTISNEENQADAEEYITYILLFVGIAIGCIIGSIFSRYLKHE